MSSQRTSSTAFTPASAVRFSHCAYLAILCVGLVYWGGVGVGG